MSGSGVSQQHQLSQKQQASCGDGLEPPVRRARAAARSGPDFAVNR
jgi:hypothetical protein